MFVHGKGREFSWRYLGIIAVVVVASSASKRHHALAQTFTWNGSISNDFNAQANWTGPTATLPGSSNVILFSNTTPNALSGTFSSAAALSVQGIVVGSGSGLITTPATGGYFNVGNSGIDMTSATRDLTLGQISLAASQTWNVAAGRTLTVAAGSGVPISSSQLLTLGGSGTVSTIRLMIDGTFNQNGGTLVPTDTGIDGVRVGQNGTLGVYNLSGGTLALGVSSLRIGTFATTSGGTFNMTGGAVTSSSGATSIRIGNRGNGVYRQSAGRVDVGTFSVGSINSDTVGSAIISGGTVTATTVQVGTTGTLGTSTLTLSSPGVLNLSGTATVGSNTAGTGGRMTLSGTVNFTNTAATMTTAATGSIIADGATLYNNTPDGANGTVSISTPIEIRSGNLTVSSPGAASGNRRMTLTGNLSGTGALIVATNLITGGGAVQINGTNTFTGGITIQSGNLESSNALPYGTSLAMPGGGLALGADSAIGSWTGTGLLYGGDGLRTLTVGVNDVSSTFGGSANSHSIVKVGTGTLTFTGSMGLAGNANEVRAGTLQIGNGGTTGELPAAITNNATLIFNRSNALTHANVISGSGQLIKQGAGTLTFTGSNTFSGATTISTGIISIGGTSALAGTSGVTIAGGAGLTYTGGAATFTKNVTVTAGSGTGTITNSGGGLLTLSGNLSKDNSVLRLTGGAFEVTGLITGTTPNASDLVVDAASVTLSNTNSYNGPTFVYGSGTLSLGINNAIPNTSRVELGNATTRGTLVLGAYSDSISQLVFTGSGGTVSLSGDKTASPQLATAGSLTLGSNSNLVLTNASTSAGLYRLISATSISGSFASITGTNAAYQIVTSSTSIDYQQRAVLGAVTVTNPAVSIITGGSAAFTYTVANAALSGGASLSFTGTGLSNVAGSSSGSATAAGTSSSSSGLVFTGTTVGANQQGTFTVSAPTAFGATSTTGTVTVNVLDHATSSLASSLLTSTTVSLGTWNYATQTWESGGNSAAFSIFNLASSTGATSTADLALLSVSGTGNGFTTNLASYADIAGGTSSQFSIFFTPSGLSSPSTQSTQFQIAMGDKRGLSGATNSNTLFVTANVIVVPEPGTLLLAGLGATIACWFIRRRTSA